MPEMTRTAEVNRETGETRVKITLSLDGAGPVTVKTGIGMFDHMVHALGFHAGWTLELACQGDLDVDDHHSIEDAGLTLGQALAEAMGPTRSGIVRFGSAYAPLDEALARAVVDVSGRSHYSGQLHLERDRVGALSCEMVPHFFHSLAQAAGLTLHVDVIRGANDHHRIEACFKAVALALRSALAMTANRDGIRSTKGVL